MYSSLFKIVIISCAVFGLQACSKVTLANYDRVEMGMIKSDVEIILGEPDQCEAVIGTQSCVWGEQDGANIKVSFIAHRAAVITHSGLK
jgi:hypothetical protein